MSTSCRCRDPEVPRCESVVTCWNGTLSLYAALNVSTGAVEGMTAPRYTSAEFLRFLDRVIATQPAGRKIQLIADKLSAHKTKAVDA